MEWIFLILLLIVLVLTFGSVKVTAGSGESGEPMPISDELMPTGTFAGLALCICVFKGRVGKLTVDASCKGNLNLWLIPENAANPAVTPVTAGTTYDADGFKIGNQIYKVDGSTCVTIKCTPQGVVFEACINLIALMMGKKAPYPVPAGTFANEPPAGAPALPVN